MMVAPGLRDQDLARVDDHQLVAVDYFAGFIHGADAVGVAIEGDAQFGLGFAHFIDEGLEVFGDRRVGVMVREAAVHFEVHFGGVGVEALEEAVHHGTAGAVAGVDGDFDAAREVELGGDFVDVGSNTIGGRFAAFAAESDRPIPSCGGGPV